MMKTHIIKKKKKGFHGPWIMEMVRQEYVI